VAAYLQPAPAAPRGTLARVNAHASRSRAARLTVALAVALGAWRVAAADEHLQRRLATEDPARVAAELRAQAEAAPYDGLVWVRLAEVERFRCDLPAAHAALDRAARDPLDPAARAGRAEALLLEARGAEALAEADRGLAHGASRTDADLWRVRALALVELRRYPEAREAAERAVALAPADARAAEALGRAAYHALDMPAARRAYGAAVRLDPDAEEANLRLGNGFGPAFDARPWEREPDLAPFRDALARWDAGDLDAAAAGFRALLERAPESFKYRLGLGAVLATRRRAHEARSHDAGGPSLYALLPVREPRDLLAVLPDAGRLSPRRRHALLVAAAPLAPWWPALVAAGARHDLMDLPENLADREARAELRTRLTFDGRHYDHLRGVGGQHAATGVEKLDEAADLAFHTLAHELAHQVLSHAFPAEVVARVKALYARAVLEDRCLDYYAASNVDEYFAQGYEAFVSHVKRGCLKETQRHTRAELRARDPALYAFLVEHLDLAHETPEALAAFRARLDGRGAPAAPTDR
jgi:tetratricopeptide (TPR) repeat protein